jgi:hypothetical protein
MNKTLKVINEWDPMKFLSHAPEDEYEEEVKLINELLTQTNDVNEFAIGIQSIFTRMFEEDYKKSYEDCLYAFQGSFFGGGYPMSNERIPHS